MDAAPGMIIMFIILIIAGVSFGFGQMVEEVQACHTLKAEDQVESVWYKAYCVQGNRQ